MIKLFFFLIFSTSVFAYWTFEKCTDLATDGYFTAGSQQTYNNSYYNMGLPDETITKITNCGSIHAYTVYYNNSTTTTNFEGYRISYTFTPGACPSPLILNPETNECECPLPPANYNDAVTSITTQSECTLQNALAAAPAEDGDTHYISGVQWDSCRNQCLVTYTECSCNQNIKNGVCSDIPLPSGCPSNAAYENYWALCVGDGCKYASGCTKMYYHFVDGVKTSCGSSSAGCCVGGTGNGGGDSQPDNNSSNPDSNSSGSGDSNSTNPDDSNGTNPDDGSGGSGGGDSGGSVDTNSTDSNTSGGGTGGGGSGGDSNSSVLVDGALLGEADFNTALDNATDFKDDVLQQFTDFKSNIQNHLNDIQSKYNATHDMFKNGTPPVMSGGGSLDCASFTFHGKRINLDLSKVAIIQPLVYYIFTAYFMFLNFVFLVNHLFRGID